MQDSCASPVSCCWGGRCKIRRACPGCARISLAFHNVSHKILVGEDLEDVLAVCSGHRVVLYHGVSFHPCVVLARGGANEAVPAGQGTPACQQWAPKDKGYVHNM